MVFTLGRLTAPALTLREGVYEGRPHFVIRTASAEYWLDRAAGGFSRMIDRDGHDWISFRKKPLSQFPESAGAGYRGMPNAVFGRDNPDAGAGHPGFDQGESEQAPGNVIRTVSRSGRWAWTWTFTETEARLKFEKNDPDRAYWFLYEGTPGGRFSPANQFWGTDLGGPNFEVPDLNSQRFGHWRWAYFGDRAVPRVLAVAQVEADRMEDTFWYLGASDGGAATAAEGMVVFGLGRTAGSTPLFRGPHTFVVGFVETATPDGAGHEKITGQVKHWLSPAAP